ncbi:2-acylglycerol O-acyltransferase 3 isoform X1 [Monodelphis domestica]|uniref:Acyltransferase n=1 Tax=Monodelphis domestica TaxID=13616 RepID=F7FKS4_MONDO|nr:2-acylglycerol O-acyltransferase 3 isoform X1 [Monodelphis domestica]XP_007483333.1 2-acylglycerol O-acyltransferase 3 isoform X1 [Monodelphis domestica]
MKTPKKQRIEIVSVYQFVLTFLFMGLFFSLLFFFLFFTSFWFLSVLYLVWLFLDWDTPDRGGRRFEWVRNWKVWEHFRDYYPIKLVKTAELSPDKNYVLGSHPHGIMCAGSFCNFATESNGFSRQFPGIRPFLAGLAGLFRIPVYRDYLMSCGLCPVSRQSLDFVLSGPQRGQAVVILVGGANESLHGVPGEHCLTLLKRQGFVRLALRHGASLVPVYSFGENEIFTQASFGIGSWQRTLQAAFKKFTGFAPCIFWGRGLLFRWGLLPFPVPITTVVGCPIPVPYRPNPSQEEVDWYHKIYMEALEQMFEEHKESCGVSPSTHLRFI